MSDIEKLQKVIESLEEQSSHVTEFHGVLGAISSAKDQIESSKTLLSNLAQELSSYVTDGYKRFNEYGSSLIKLESNVASLSEIQSKIFQEIAILDSLTSERFEKTRVATKEAMTSLREIQIDTLKEIATLGFVTKSQFEEARIATEEIFATQLAALTEKINGASLTHQSALNSLQKTVVIGLVLLLGGIAFLAKDTFL